MQVGHDETTGTEGLWDAREVARFLKTSRSWVYQKAEAGLLPCIRIGGLLRFEPAAVRRWVSSLAGRASAGRVQPGMTE